MKDAFAATYPNIARFIKNVGTIEIGHHHDFPVTSFIRAINLGDTAWESADHYPTFDAALADLEAGLGEWLAEAGIE